METDQKTTLHFIRHADAMPEAGSVVHDETGYDLMGLSRKGAAQAHKLAERLAKTTKLTAIYASPTRRAFETAEAIARTAGATVETDLRLREIFLGDESVADFAPEERARVVRERLVMFKDIALRDGSWSSVPGVEPGSEVRARMSEAVDEIAGRHAGGHVAVVSHAGSINAYLATMLGVARDFFFPIGNTSLSSVRFAGGRALLLRINDLAHLE